MTLFDYDRAQGVELLCGVDEAGRGPLAGDVYAAAVILPPDCAIAGLDDSKKLTEKKREALFDEIREKAVSYCIATASVEEIERLNILQATFLAMNRAVAGLSVKPKLVLVDGNKNPIERLNSRAVVKGDATSASIAAASVLAKVARDRYMQTVDAAYPEYCFCKHKGYGTKLHYEMLDKYGPSPVHRMSFLKKYLAAKTAAPKAKQTGDTGEKLACKYLKKHGFKLLETNYRTGSGEIDIIAADGEMLIFAEVKTRAQDALYAPVEAVDRKKQARIVKAAIAYLHKNGMTGRQIRFDVLEVTIDGSKPDIRAVHHIENAFSGEDQHVYL